ncbi:hypothetical protein GCM10011521_06250 [Arenimonas soli]|uniref:M23ase beta-sheet core domain-containing protein n=1 Tax=Arenimonas soli TaxID=2269504 RepID=A0ABQ1HDH1_9GAMM|nr:M23 family metallopeptidase [Arenimonas soli]GGA70878.1 hypothetical protein GCM10011521_06250 [Arenimonas soli]
MNLPPKLLALALAALLPSAAAVATDLDIRFHPSAAVWSYPLEDARSLNGVLVQNTALVNREDHPVTVQGVEVQALRQGQVLSSVRLGAPELARMAAQGQAMSQAGMLDALAFQFAPEHLLGTGTPLAATATLAPGEALMLPQQFVAYRGPGDTLRVVITTQGDPTPSVRELPIRNGQAPGEFRFPLEGRWFVGAAASAHGHHRWVVPQEFALDISRLGEGGLTYRGDGSRMQDYHAYGATVLASADGEVVKAVDGIADNVAMLRAPGEALPDYIGRLHESQAQLLAGGLDQISGNHLVIRHAEGVYSVYAHLSPGSLKVAVGDRVQSGQAIGLLGGSGNSTEPHLHFHLCDGPDPLQCAGLPVAFSNIELPFSEAPRSLQSGDMVDTHR